MECGTLTLSAREGSAQAADYGRFGRTSFSVEPDDFEPVEVNGSSRYQASYAAAVAITDDADSESNESFSHSRLRRSMHLELSFLQQQLPQS